MIRRSQRGGAGRCFLIVLVLATCLSPLACRDSLDTGHARSGAEWGPVVFRISELLDSLYVYPDVATRMDADLVGRFEAGEFDGIQGTGAFVRAVTDILQTVSTDQHIRVRRMMSEGAGSEREDSARARADADARRMENYGFLGARRLEDDIGYVPIRYFDGSEEAKAAAADAMSSVAETDAIIFDVRRSRGGSPEMIRYLSSWFFDEPTRLSSIYWRPDDRTQEFWTSEEIPGVQRPNVPIFVLTSSNTFSAAEAFGYDMKALERATLIGEVTRGGAHPGGFVPINDRLEMFIPTGAAVNPITGTNWEGVGVTPHVEVSADEALDVALEHARAAAQAYRR